MAPLALVMLAAAEFDDANLVALAMTLHRGDDLGRSHIGSANGHRGSGADQQHLIEFDAGALIRIELLDTHYGTFLDAVLFTARGNHGIHYCELREQPNGAAKEPRIVRLGRPQVKPKPLPMEGRRPPTRGGRRQCVALASPILGTMAHSFERFMTLEQIRGLVTADFEAVDRVVKQRLHSQVALVDQVATYIIYAGGKRLRPLLVLLAARACGHTGERHLDAAAIIEFIHTATLLHDDVVDGSSLRRGRETANEVFGNATSVLVGDFLYSRAFQMMVTLDRMKIMQILADATNAIAEGEVLQLMNAHDPNTTEARYIDVIRRKTARLFEAGAQIAAVLSDAPPHIEESLALYGRHIGTAFQLVDDALDYQADEASLGKHLGDDLAEGKPTLPLIYAMQHGSDAQRAMIRHAIENGGLDQLAEITRAVASLGGLAYTARLAQCEADQALAALAPLPETAFKEGLSELAKFAVARKN
jgi:octaprenyl-diphosphate synthase